MNERIRELVAQAEDYASEHEEHWHDGPDWQELFSTKFAELIVRECMNIAYEYDAPKMSGPGMIIANRIEQHFGVEE